ncbi:MAG: hypothetical protein KKF65_03055 [Nanoarchaeota archaeon]|nr:hypothetical protein [Nanoarchaeota archaeon]
MSFIKLLIQNIKNKNKRSYSELETILNSAIFNIKKDTFEATEAYHPRITTEIDVELFLDDKRRKLFTTKYIGNPSKKDYGESLSENKSGTSVNKPYNPTYQSQIRELRKIPKIIKNKMISEKEFNSTTNKYANQNQLTTVDINEILLSQKACSLDTYTNNGYEVTIHKETDRFTIKLNNKDLTRPHQIKLEVPFIEEQKANFNISIQQDSFFGDLFYEEGFTVKQLSRAAREYLPRFIDTAADLALEYYRTRDTEQKQTEITYKDFIQNISLN